LELQSISCGAPSGYEEMKYSSLMLRNAQKASTKSTTHLIDALKDGKRHFVECIGK
jgi:hypothetical protein